MDPILTTIESNLKVALESVLEGNRAIAAFQKADGDRLVTAARSLLEILKTPPGHRPIYGFVTSGRPPLVGFEPRDPVPSPPPGCDHGTMINQNLPTVLGIGMRIDSNLPPGTLEVWQDGKRIGRIENIGKREDQ